MTPSFARSVLLVHAGATLFMVGLIWFVQVVHYPLFDRVGAEGFRTYAADHQHRTTWVVGPVMLVEALTAGLLLLVRDERAGYLPWLGLGLLLVVWLSTAFLQVPRHGILSAGFEPAAYRYLVLSNWLRTAAWTARGAVALGLVGRWMA